MVTFNNTSYKPQSKSGKAAAAARATPVSTEKKRVTVNGKRFSVPVGASDQYINMRSENIDSKNNKGGSKYSQRELDSVLSTPAVPEGDMASESSIQEDPLATSLPQATQKAIQNMPGDTVSQPADMDVVNRYRQQFESQDMGTRYKQGFEQVQQSGTPAPETQGAAAPTLQSYIKPQAQDMSAVDTLLQEDEGFNDLKQMFTDYFNPDNQKTSLVKEYKKLYSQSGLDELDEEILDAKTIIEGTEDDIRNEIQAAGGFGTESQVQALSSSRNKVLLKNYNNLVAMREVKQQNFDKMLDLTIKDREYADQKMEQMLNFQFKIMDYKQKFIDNTRTQLNTIADKLGYQALYDAYSRDPRQLAFAEQIMGVGPGGLLNLASQIDLDRELKLEQISTEKAQRANIYSQISERDNTSGTKKKTDTQNTTKGFADRSLEANAVIDELGSNFTGFLARFGENQPNEWKSSDRQKFEQAQRNFINAVLRKESGATITPEEFENAKTQYFPRPGDKEEVVLQKAQNRQTVINSLYEASGEDVIQIID